MDKEERPTRVQIKDRTYKLYYLKTKGVKKGVIGCIRWNGIYLTKIEAEAGDIIE